MLKLIVEGELYTATVSDFSGSDPLIYKEPLRTEQYDSKILNSKCPEILVLQSCPDFFLLVFGGFQGSLIQTICNIICLRNSFVEYIGYL